MRAFLVSVVCVAFASELVFAAPAAEQLSRQKRQYNGYEAEQRYEEEVQNAYVEAETQYQEAQENAYREAEEQYEQAQQEEYQREVDEYNQQVQAQEDAYVQQQEEMAREAAESYYAGGYRYGRSTRQKRNVPANGMYVPSIPMQHHFFNPNYPVAAAAVSRTSYHPAVSTSFQPTVSGSFQPAVSASYHPAVPATFQAALPATYQAALPATYQGAVPASYQPAVASNYQPTNTVTNPVAHTTYDVKQYTCIDFLDMIFKMLLQDRLDMLSAQFLAAVNSVDDYDDYGTTDYSWDNTVTPTPISGAETTIAK